MTFIDKLNWRYATKKFNGEKVSQENLATLLEAIKLTPTSFGTQPFHVHVVSDKDMLEKLKKYSPNNETKLETCSHLLIFSARTDIKSRFAFIQKVQNRKDNFMLHMGNVFQYFLPFASIFSFGRFLTKTSWSRNQTYIALGFGLFACADLDIDSCPLEGFNARAFSRILDLPYHIKPSVLLAIGYRSPDEKLFPKFRFDDADLFTKI